MLSIQLEPRMRKTHQCDCASGEDLDQSRHQLSPVRLFAYAQCNLSVRFAHAQFVGFIMPWFKGVRALRGYFGSL